MDIGVFELNNQREGEGVQGSLGSAIAWDPVSRLGTKAGSDWHQERRSALLLLSCQLTDNTQGVKRTASLRKWGMKYLSRVTMDV